MVVLIGGLLAAAAAGSSAGTSGPAWLNLLNQYREASGLSPVTEQPSWTPAVAAHLRYLALTSGDLIAGKYASWHTENPASPYYSAAGAAAGGASNLIFLGDHDADADAISGLLAAPFHAVAMLNPLLTQVAFARDSTDHSTRNNTGLDVGDGAPPVPLIPKPVFFPGPGMTTNLAAYENEEPSPLATCNYTFDPSGRTPVGLPLIAMLPQTPSPSISATLTAPDGTVSASGSPDLCLVTQYNYVPADPVYGPAGIPILTAFHAVFVIPKHRLVPGSYTVHLSQPGSPDLSWAFTVVRTSQETHLELVGPESPQRSGSAIRLTVIGLDSTHEPIPGLTITLFARRVGTKRWVQVSHTTIGTNGVGFVTVRPTTDTDYSARFAGSPSLNASTSFTKHIRVRPK